MRADRPSFTAAFVAGARGLGSVLPREARLVHDPFGLDVAGPVAHAIDAVARRVPIRAVVPYLGPAANIVVWMQLRTRRIDDVVRAFGSANVPGFGSSANVPGFGSSANVPGFGSSANVPGFGRPQIVLLGAGFDFRAARLREAIGSGTVFEVDHPATQRAKRDIVTRAHAESESARVEYIAWDFEREPMERLPARLEEAGHDPTRPTITIWEGVTMYLTESAIDSSVRAVRSYSGPNSRFVVTWFDRATLEHPSLRTRVTSFVVARAGEPHRFGWDPREFAPWMRERGFDVEDDASDVELAARYGVPTNLSRALKGRGAHVSVLRQG